MTIQEAHRQFNLFLDKVSSESTPELTHKQIDVYLHEAEVRIVKQAYGRSNIYKQGYQEIQKRTDDLNTLVKTGYLAWDNNTPIDGVYTFKLDTVYTNESPVPGQPLTNLPYMFFLKAMVKVESDTVNPVYTSISLISQDKYTEVINDPFNKSRISSPIAFFEDGAIKIDTNKGDFTPLKIRLTYLAYPTEVVWKADGIAGFVNSILPEEKQREAIQLAISVVLEGLESQRLNGNINMLSTSE